uniref:hypothetical protein n=1 Tax=Hassallia byssoidea TaxID=482630 RepID=UPI000B237AF6|nr:hypothetical protein [Hassalia byssoidea]
MRQNKVGHQLQSSILRFVLLPKGSVGILPVFLAIAAPFFSSSVYASTLGDRLRGVAETSTAVEEMGGQGDKEIGGQGDKEIGGQGDKEDKEDKADKGEFTSSSPTPPLSPSPTPPLLPSLISQISQLSPTPGGFPEDPATQFQQNPASPIQQTVPPPSQQTPLQAPPTTQEVLPNSTPQTVGDRKARIEFAPVGDPRVQADGRSTIKLSGQITDDKGQLINKDVMVTLTTTAGKFVGADQDKDQPGFQVRAIGGEFVATLQSEIKPQQVRIRAGVDKIKTRNRVRQLPPRAIGQPSIPYIGETDTTGESKPFPQQNDTSLFELIGNKPLEAYTQVEFTTYLRPSLVTGIINLRIGQRGTDYWGSRRDFLAPGESGGTQVDFYSAVFATGKVGDWLFTGAYNSQRPLNQDCEDRNRLFGGIQFCEQQYPVYGDSSTFTSTAPSIDSVYARFERSSSVPGAETDYLMWGDYNTQEFNRSSQLYTATSRQLHGFKANYNFGNLQVTGLYANNIEGFQRDTFVPNGTSGNYFLSKRLIVPGSEIVYVEAEEIQRPGTVRGREQLYRGQDYEIDYDRGTLLFRRPILATDFFPNFGGVTLVRRVVVTYQNEGGEDSKLYGGRLQYNLSNDLENKTFVAGSYLREDQGDQDFQLYGADFLVSLGNSGRIVGEFARSNSDLLTGQEVTGNAYRLEAFGNIGDRLSASAYYRGVEPNFANNATFSFAPGQTRYGASLLARVTDTTSFTVGYDLEENYGRSTGRIVDFFDLFNPQPQTRVGDRVSNELRTFRAGILQRIGNADASLEYVNRSRDDRVSDRFSGNASQLVSRLKLPLTQSLTFQAQNELNINGSDPLYPNRTTFGLDWKAFQGVTVRLAHQFYDDSELLRGNSFTTLDTIFDRKLAEDTAITGRYSVLSGFNGLQGQGAVGLDQGFRVAPGLKVNVGYQYIFRNIFNATAAGNRNEQYYAVGQTASSLGLFAGSVYSVGLEYTDNPDFKASTRFEYRDGDEGNNLVISAAASGKLSPALTALVRFQQAGEANVFLPTSAGIVSDGVRFQELGDTSNLRFGIAYRDPSNDKFNALLKYEWRQNFDSIPEAQLTGSTATGHVFSAEAIYAPNWRWEFYGKYALRNGVTYDGGNRYDGSVNLAQMRASYRLGYRTDLAVEGRWIGQNSNSGTDYDEFGIAVESGYYLTPDLRVGLGYSFGSVDDRDFTGYRSEGGFYVNISLKLNELLGGFGLQKPVPRQQQESEVGPTASRNGNSQSKLINRLRLSSAQNSPDKLVSRLKQTQPPVVEESKAELIKRLR